jgi:hypothetical protein
VTLKNLKKELDFFEYYRIFVSWYSFIEKSLIKFKTQIFKKALRKDKQRFEWALKIYLEQSDLNLMKSEYQKNSRKIKPFKICINAWKELKKQLCNAILRVFSNFSRFFILYVDERKKRNFEIVLHQIEKNDVKRFILFPFKSLIEVESRYWATKLETTTFVWVLTKLSQYFDDDFFIVITDHFALKSTLQIRIIERRSQRLNEWVMFLFTFLSKMTIIHRFDKNHLNADELSRLTFVEDDKEEQRNTQKYDENDLILTLLISTEIAHSNFLNVVRDEILKNDVFERIFQKIINQMKNSKKFTEIANFKYQSYRLNSESKLLYLTKRTSSNRLCISTKLSKDILFHAHHANAHDEIHQIYDFLQRSIFMTNMKKKVTEYVTTCSFCQISKNFNQKSYEELQFISIFQKFFFEMSLNFVVKLLMIIKKNNAFLTVIDRFSKYVKLISETKSFSAAIWIERYWEFVYRSWKVFHRIVFDKDSKFTSEFWRKLFNKCDLKMNFITTYHFSANRSSKEIYSNRENRTSLFIDETIREVLK